MATSLARLFRASALGALAASLLLFTPGARAQDCLEFGDYLRWAGTAPTAGPAQGVVATADNLMIVPEGYDGVEIFRFEPDGGPVPLAVIPALAQANVAFSYPPFLAVGDGSWLILYDLTVPESPAPIDTIPFGLGNISALAGGPEALLVGHQGYGVSLVTISPTGEFSLGGTLMLGGDAALDIAIGPDLAYVAGGDTLFVLDTAAGPAPTRMGQLGLPGQAYAVAAQDGMLYLSGPAGGLQTVDASDPAAPTLVGSVDSPVFLDLLVGDGWLYASGDVVEMFELGDPSSPQSAGAVRLPDAQGAGLVWFSEMLIAADGASGLHGFEHAAFPPAPATAEYRLPDGPMRAPARAALPGSGVYDLAAVGDLVLLAPLAGPPLIVDVSDPENPSDVATVDMIPPAVAVAMVPEGFCAIAADGGLSVVMITDPYNPELIGSCDTGVTAESCTIDGNYLYIAAGGDGVIVADLSDPTQPVTVRLVDTDGFASRVAVADGYAYVADGDAGLAVIDVSDPATAVVVGQLDTDGEALGVALSDFRAFVADGAGGFVIVDVSEPTNPRQLHWSQMPTAAMDVAVANGLAYVTDRVLGVLVAEAGVYDWGRWIGLISLPSGGPDRIFLTDSGLVAEVPEWGFVTAPAGCSTLTPVFLSSFSAELSADVVALRWQAAVSGQGEFRLVARVGGSERDIAFSTLGNGLFTARDTAAPAGGSVTYALLWREADEAWTTLAERALDLPAARTALLNPWPNPFNPRTTVAFTLARAGLARVTVYDAAGRLVAVLADGPCAAGRTELTWDGTDARGHALASGTFLLRLEADGSLATRRLTLVR